MTDIYLTLNEVQTHIINWGDPFNCNGSDVIVCISGNPGIVDFYREFCTILHQNTGLTVCAIGQAGHEKVPDKQSNELKGQENLLNLEGQIRHKLDLINKIIDKGSKVHLVGHSIGSWMIIECLKKNRNVVGKIASVNFLFPTVQRIAESRNGLFLNNVTRRLHFIIIFLITILDLIPESILGAILNCYMKLNSIPPNYHGSIMKLLKNKILEKVLFLAYDEMDYVTTFNSEIIELVKYKTNVVYNTYDGWAPMRFINDFRQFEPAITMREVNAGHSFVLHSSGTVAEIVSDFIKNKVEMSIAT